MYVCIYGLVMHRKPTRTKALATNRQTHTHTDTDTLTHNTHVCNMQVYAVGSSERKTTQQISTILFNFFLHKNGTIAICLDAMDKIFYTSTVYFACKTED